jgi:hypothetical protein
MTMTRRARRLSRAARLAVAALGALVVACSPARDDPARDAERGGDSSGTASVVGADRAEPAVAVPGALPPIGLAVPGDDGWCAAIVADTTRPALQPGALATIVLSSGAPMASVPARIGARRAAECPAAFPQPRWTDYHAYVLVPTGADSGALATVAAALLVVHDAPWTRGADGRVRADIDGDGRPEELRRCTADEGEHLTLWSARADGGRVRRWHEYFDWGAFTEPTCGPGEDGGDPSTIGPA